MPSPTYQPRRGARRSSSEAKELEDEEEPGYSLPIEARIFLFLAPVLAAANIEMNEVNALDAIVEASLFSLALGLVGAAVTRMFTKEAEKPAPVSPPRPTSPEMPVISVPAYDKKTPQSTPKLPPDDGLKSVPPPPVMAEKPPAPAPVPEPPPAVPEPEPLAPEDEVVTPLSAAAVMAAAAESALLAAAKETETADVAALEADAVLSNGGSAEISTTSTLPEPSEEHMPAPAPVAPPPPRSPNVPRVGGPRRRLRYRAVDPCRRAHRLHRIPHLGCLQRPTRHACHPSHLHGPRLLPRVRLIARASRRRPLDEARYTALPRLLLHRRMAAPAVPRPQSPLRQSRSCSRAALQQAAASLLKAPNRSH